jgi:hypothetical protein
LTELSSELDELSPIHEALHTSITQVAANQIKDIANGLLAQGRGAISESTDGTDRSVALPVTIEAAPKTVELLSAVIESSVAQKRLQFKERKDFEIRFDLLTDDGALFSEVQTVELHRIISNIINYSVEAFETGGIVTVTLSDRADLVEIQIADNGKGIPPELLSKVVEHGGTFGKNGGNGLGLSHAKATLESWGGAFILQSKPGIGTKVILQLGKAESPSWFISALQVAPETTVVIADDDSSIHALWDRRLAEFVPSERLVHLYSPGELLGWYRKNLLIDPVLYLCDLEFAGHDQTGLDLVEMTGITPQAVLVTGRWDEESIRGRCMKLGLKIIPKCIAEYIQISRSID